MSPLIRIDIKSSSMRFPGRERNIRLYVDLKHSEKIFASDIFIPNKGLSYSIPTCLAPYVNDR